MVERAPADVHRLTDARGGTGFAKPRARIESANEMDYESLLESLEVRDIGDMPQIVMTAGRHRITPADITAPQAAARASSGASPPRLRSMDAGREGCRIAPAVARAIVPARLGVGRR